MHSTFNYTVRTCVYISLPVCQLIPLQAPLKTMLQMSFVPIINGKNLNMNTMCVCVCLCAHLLLLVTINYAAPPHAVTVTTHYC